MDQPMPASAPASARPHPRAPTPAAPSSEPPASGPPSSGSAAPDGQVALDAAAFRALFDYLGEAVLCLRNDGVMRFASGGIRALLGYDPESITGRNMADFIHPDELAHVLEALARWDGRSGDPMGEEVRVLAADGAWRTLRYDTTMGIDLGALGDMIITLYAPHETSDETRQLRYRLLVEERLTRLATIVLHAPHHRFDQSLEEAMFELGSLDWVGRASVWTIDPDDPGRADRRAVWSSPTIAPLMPLAASLGLDALPVLRNLCDGVEMHIDMTVADSDALAPNERAVFHGFGLHSALGLPLLIDGSCIGFLLVESTVGDVAHLSVTTATARAAATFLAGAFRRHDAERQLADQARTDRVTGLGNRWAFEEDLRLALGELAAARSPGVGLALVDLDRFKLVNDSLGHAAGDRLLQKVAARLSGAADDDTVLARLGGDELLVLLRHSDSMVDTHQRIDRLMASLRAPFDVAAHVMRVTASVGLVHVDEVEVGPGELLRRADVAMYRAKALGGHTIELDEPGARAHDGANLRREAELRDALRHRGLVVHYQGEWDITTGGLLGAEALVRWPHPTEGMLTAAEFVPLAEERGLINEMGWVVLRDACRTAAPWAMAAGPDRFVLRVNVGADQLRNRDFADKVVATITEVGFPPTALCLELTESALLSDPKGSAELFEQLRDHGIGLAIDDFGTGYSSMLQLKQLPLSALKIDRSFVMGLPATSIDRAVVRSTVQLAEALGASVTAEGVETQEQLGALIDLGCTRAQGFLLARPEPADVFEGRVCPVSGVTEHGVSGCR